MEFFKYSALGNCFVVVPSRHDPTGAHRDEAARICDAASGVAADGVAYVRVATRRLHIYNADGSRASISGNGARCAAAWWFARPIRHVDYGCRPSHVRSTKPRADLSRTPRARLRRLRRPRPLARAGTLG